MAYKYLTQYNSPNYSAGRPAGPPNAIFIHYWDDPAKKPTFDGVVSWLCRKGGNSSAHYVVEAGRVACIVDCKNRAWHAGNQGNPRGIGIECNPRMSAGDLETVAELIADLRRTYGNLPLKPHNSVMDTSCPGPYVGKLGWLSARANEILAGNPSTPTPSAGGAPTSGAHTGSLTKTDKQLELRVDGSLGGSTVARWQQVMGTPIDGVISKNSQLIAAFQRFLNKELGAGHIKNLTGKTALAVDGTLGPATTKAWQFWSANRFPAHLKNIKGWTLTSANFSQWVDGSFGPNTVRMLQAALNDSYANSGKIGAK